VNPHDIDDVLSGRRQDLAARGLRLATALAEPVYWSGLLLHRTRYRLGFKQTHRVFRPVISIGNLTTGGTGKTPFTALLVKQLQNLGRTPGIASRGYKSLENDTEPAAGNDEKLVLDQMCPDVPHIQNRDRVAAAEKLIELGCDCILLDDGFQHRRLERDLDIVLIDAANPFGHNHLLPRGLLREPLSALKRASLIVLTRVDQVDRPALDAIITTIRRHAQVPIIEVRFAPTSWLSTTGEITPLENHPGTAATFCGIGNPTGFTATLKQCGITIPDGATNIFPDHYHYTREDFEKLAAVATEKANGQLVTTLKDLVKIRELVPAGIDCRALLIEAVVTQGADDLQRLLNIVPQP